MLFLQQPRRISEAPPAWRNVRKRLSEVREAANRLAVTNNTVSHEKPETASPKPRPLSTIEKLPEEILVGIMELLDYESLYHLSQTTGRFLRLSFDLVFELDPAWRAFRHTVDTLSDGPKGRVLNGARLVPQVMQRFSLAKGRFEWAAGDSGRSHEDGDFDEGETMLEFMARS